MPSCPCGPLSDAATEADVTCCDSCPAPCDSGVVGVVTVRAGESVGALLTVGGTAVDSAADAPLDAPVDAPTDPVEGTVAGGRTAGAAGVFTPGVAANVGGGGVATPL